MSTMKATMRVPEGVKVGLLVAGFFAVILAADLLFALLSAYAPGGWAHSAARRHAHAAITTNERTPLPPPGGAAGG